MNLKSCLSTVSLVALLVPALPHATPAETKEKGGVIYLEQGWDEDTRQYYYHTTQGTAMLPLAFYKYIEQSDSDKLFSDPDHLRSLGMTPGETDPKHNPEGLPIGLALNDVKSGMFQGKWVGFTCSSCHNSELYYQGKTIRVDGGSNHIFSMPRSARALREATHATLKDDAKLTRMIERAGPDAPMVKSQVKAALTEISETLDYFADRVAGSPHDFGPGRMDALNQIHNTILGGYLEVPENVVMTNAPTKSPFVWNSPQSAWVQWSAVLHRPITRNLGESLGAMTRVNLDPEKGELFDSTVTFETQRKLEKVLQTLAPPQWPEDIFGAIDQDLAAKGKTLVEENCSSCHTSYPYRWSPERKMGKRFVENGLIPQSYVGTDIMQFKSSQLNPDPDFFTGLVQPLMKEPLKGAAAAPDLAIQEVLKWGLIDKYVPGLNLTEEEWLEWNNYSLISDVEGAPKVASYKAAPLDGMWAAPPYLHNGSVPTLYDLLSPASERPEKWTQGREFDPVKVGLETGDETGDFVFDASLIGMSNKGHSFEDAPLGNGVVGRKFTDDERRAIIEYMKTLPNGPNQQAPYGGPQGDFVDAWAKDSNYFNATQPSGYFNGYDGTNPNKGDQKASN